MLKVKFGQIFMMASVVTFSFGLVYGYIDPGTGVSFAAGLGGIIMGFLTLVFGVLAVTFKKWISKVKSLFSFLGSKIRKPKSS